jgi:hypothetical protein
MNTENLVQIKKKKCPRCNNVLSIDFFGRDVSRHDNIRIYCKECVREICKDNTKNKWEKLAKANRKYRLTHLEQMTERNKIYRESNKENIAKKRKIRESIHPEKVQGKNAIAIAVRSGKIIRPSLCYFCGIDCKPDAHHPDYNKPLDVLWLCKSCHIKLHESIRRYAEMTDPFNIFD